MRTRTLNTLAAAGLWLAIALLLFGGYVALLEIAGSPGHHQQQTDTQARRSREAGSSISLQPRSPGDEQTRSLFYSDSDAKPTDWIQAASMTLIAILTFVVLIVYRRQTKVMIFALAETRKAADSASRTIRVLESVAQHHLRAYIGIEKIGFTSKTSQKPRLVSSGLSIEDLILVTTRNYGNTSAYDVRTSVNLVATAAGNKLPDDFSYMDISGPTADRESYKEPVIIEPGRSHVVRCPYASEFRKKVDEARMKKINLYVYGHIDYSDIFNRRWERTFCFHYAPHAGAKDKFAYYERHNNERCIFNPSLALTT